MGPEPKKLQERRIHAGPRAARTLCWHHTSPNCTPPQSSLGGRGTHDHCHRYPLCLSKWTHSKYKREESSTRRWLVIKTVTEQETWTHKHQTTVTPKKARVIGSPRQWEDWRWEGSQLLKQEHLVPCEEWFPLPPCQLMGELSSSGYICYDCLSCLRNWIRHSSCKWKVL